MLRDNPIRPSTGTNAGNAIACRAGPHGGRVVDRGRWIVVARSGTGARASPCQPRAPALRCRGHDL